MCTAHINTTRTRCLPSLPAWTRGCDCDRAWPARAAPPGESSLCAFGLAALGAANAFSLSADEDADAEVAAPALGLRSFSLSRWSLLSRRVDQGEMMSISFVPSLSFSGVGVEVAGPVKDMLADLPVNEL